jgi:4-hydroxybenzoate polyprenyltransferase
MREIPYFKLPLISLVWAIATVLFPVFLTGLEESVDISIVFAVVFSRGLYISGLTIPFDVRDLEIDHLDMKTVPQTMGIYSSLNWAMILIGASAILWFGLVLADLINIYVGVALGIHAILTIPFVSPRFAGIKRSEAYHSIFLDGILVLQLCVLPMSKCCFI